MTQEQRRHVVGFSVVLSAVTVGLVGTLALARTHSAEDRAAVRIEIVADGMVFRAISGEGIDRNTDNPTIRVRSGQRVEIKVRNNDPGMKHDLAIPAVGVETPALAAGEFSTFRFTAPSRGKYPYFCRVHPRIMRGDLIVEP